MYLKRVNSKIIVRLLTNFIERLIYGTVFTVLVLMFGVDASEQAVKTEIRLLPKEQSDLGLHCLPFCPLIVQIAR